MPISTGPAERTWKLVSVHRGCGPQVRMPGSTSFPSGHAASAFAFAYAVDRHLPRLAVPIRLLAGGVAYLDEAASGCGRAFEA